MIGLGGNLSIQYLSNHFKTKQKALCASSVFWQSKILCNYLFRVNLTGVKLDCVKKSVTMMWAQLCGAYCFLKATPKTCETTHKSLFARIFSPETFKGVSDDSSETNKRSFITPQLFFLTFLKLELSVGSWAMKYCYLRHKFRFCFSVAVFSLEDDKTHTKFKLHPFKNQSFLSLLIVFKP